MYKSKCKKEMLAYAANFKRLMYWVDCIEGYIGDGDVNIIKCNIINSTTCAIYLDSKPDYYIEQLKKFGRWENCWIKKSNCNDDLVVGLFWGIPYEN